jgi:hypothetical protein
VSTKVPIIYRRWLYAVFLVVTVSLVNPQIEKMVSLFIDFRIVKKFQNNTISRPCIANEKTLSNTISRICSKHFRKSDFNESQSMKVKLMSNEEFRLPSLKPGSVPSVNISDTNSLRSFLSCLSCRSVNV